MKIGDHVLVIDDSSDDYGMSGKILGNVLDILWRVELNDFTKGNYEGFFEDEQLEVLNIKDVWTQEFDVPKATYCKHEWKSDSYFSARVYKTCGKCNARHEDETLDLPF